jgi:endonuclease/exonuclease/phosphatase family metal-dependent hydrolase
MRRESSRRSESNGRRFIRGLAVSAFSVGVPACSDPFHTGFAPVEAAVTYQSSTVVSPAPPALGLNVMSYNLKFGGGRIDFFFDCQGKRVLMSRQEVLTHLEGLAEKIRQVDPDVLFVQEVDVNSKRSAHVDQLQWLLDHTSLNFAHYASHWKADFVPSDGLGPVDSGNAILSKFPLSEGTRVALALRTDQSGLERYFYLRRNLLRSVVTLPDRDPIFLVAVHTEAYSQDGTKRKHIERFEQELDTLAEQGLVVGGGDLNTLPPGSLNVSNFDDSACKDEYLADDYTEEGQWLSSLYTRYAPAIPLADYQTNNARYFSHTTRSDGFWNRKLDYLFTNGRFASGSGLTHQDATSGGLPTLLLSDHAPLSVTLELD